MFAHRSVYFGSMLILVNVYFNEIHAKNFLNNLTFKIDKDAFFNQLNISV